MIFSQRVLGVGTILFDLFTEMSNKFRNNKKGFKNQGIMPKTKKGSEKQMELVVCT